MVRMDGEAAYKEALEINPGDPIFAEYAHGLLEEQRYTESIQVALTGLSINPNLHRGRLILAHAFFRAGFIPFAIREVKELAKLLPENEQIKRLVVKLGADSATTEASQSGEVRVAEAEFDLDDLTNL